MRHAIALVLLAAGLPGQNLIRNHDFAAKDLAPWTIVNAQWMSELAWGPNGLTFKNGRDSQTPQRSTAIEQPITVAATGCHLLTIVAVHESAHDTAVPVVPSITPGMFFLGDEKLRAYRNTQLSQPFVLQAGVATLRIEFPQPVDASDAWRIERVTLVPAAVPLTLWQTLEDHAVTVRARLIESSSLSVVMLALGPLDPGMAIPGVQGPLRLDPAAPGGILFFPAGFYVPASLSAALFPAPRIHAQVLEISPALAMRLGSPDIWIGPAPK